MAVVASSLVFGTDFSGGVMETGWLKGAKFWSDFIETLHGVLVAKGECENLQRCPWDGWTAMNFVQDKAKGWWKSRSPLLSAALRLVSEVPSYRGQRDCGWIRLDQNHLAPPGFKVLVLEGLKFSSWPLHVLCSRWMV